MSVGTREGLKAMADSLEGRRNASIGDGIGFVAVLLDRKALVGATTKLQFL